jgi:hypothetical protein
MSVDEWDRAIRAERDPAALAVTIDQFQRSVAFASTGGVGDQSGFQETGFSPRTPTLQVRKLQPCRQNVTPADWLWSVTAAAERPSL